MNLQFETTTTLDATVEQSVADVPIHYMADTLNVEISNDGTTNPTTAFKLQAQDHPNGEFYTVLSTFGTLGNILRFFLLDPTALIHGTKAHLSLFVKGFYAVRLLATSASGTILTVRGGATISTRGAF